MRFPHRTAADDHAARSADPAGSVSTARHPDNRRRGGAALAAAALALALAACSPASGGRGADRVPPIPGPQGPNAPFTSSAAVDPAPAPAATPTAAVERYVAAEADGDAAAGYALLAPADRERVGSLAAWADEASDRLPLRSLAAVTLDGSTVVTDATLEARLDDSGFVPARARIEWRPVRVDGGWLVSPTGTQVSAVLPADADAGPAAAAWLAARTATAATAASTALDGQFEGNLLGRPAVLDALATLRLRPSDVHVAAVRPLAAAPDPQVATNAFGPEAARFVRTVVVDAPTRLAVLVAPLGDTWRVVGVDAPR